MRLLIANASLVILDNIQEFGIYKQHFLLLSSATTGPHKFFYFCTFSQQTLRGFNGSIEYILENVTANMNNQLV